MKKLLLTIAIIIFTGSTLQVFAEDFNGATLTPQDTSVESAETKHASLTKNDIKSQYDIAFDRFVQSNVKAAYDDYKILIETMTPSDYEYMNVAEKMASIGFFDLASVASSKISDKDYSYILVDDIQRFYYPTKQLKKDDELYLAEVFSNITYNDQSREATAELVKNTMLLASSDYANYIVALGYSKSGNPKSALEYINMAISMNPDSINYQKLKAEILAQSGKSKDAIKIVENIKKQPMNSKDFSKKINSLEQYILYKTAKKEDIKNYHLGYYYYYEGEYPKALRTLQTSSVTKKKVNKDVYALASKIYFDINEFEKAQDNAQKAYRLNGNNTLALNVLGDLSCRNKDYKTALKYYKKAADNEKGCADSSVKVAQTYKTLGEDKKANDIYTKILKSYSNCYMAYYEVALTDKSKELAYLKKSIAVNKDFKDGWIDLARVEIASQHYQQAQKYLAVANYIDENDFRYYYYQGLVYKAQGLKGDADYYFKKSATLNPNWKPEE